MSLPYSKMGLIKIKEMQIVSRDLQSKTNFNLMHNVYSCLRFFFCVIDLLKPRAIVT